MKRVFTTLMILVIMTACLFVVQNQNTDCADYVEVMQGCAEGQYYRLAKYTEDVMVFVDNGTVTGKTPGIYANVTHQGTSNVTSFGPYSSIDEAFTQGFLYAYNTATSDSDKLTYAKALIYGCGYDKSLLTTSTSTQTEETTEDEAIDTANNQTSQNATTTTNESNDANEAANNSDSNTTDDGKSDTTTEDVEENSEDDTNAQDVEKWIEISRVDATCTSEGTITYQNSLTGETKEETIEKLEHTVGEQETVVEPKLFSTGTAVVRCSVCDEVLQEIELPATFPTWGYGVVGAIVLIIIGSVVVIAKKKTSATSNPK